MGSPLRKASHCGASAISVIAHSHSNWAEDPNFVRALVEDAVLIKVLDVLRDVLAEANCRDHGTHHLRYLLVLESGPCAPVKFGECGVEGNGR